MPGLAHFLILGAALFCLGTFGALARRNAVVVLMSIELMLNGLNITFVAFNRYLAPSFGPAASAWAGQVFALFIIAVAAAEAALGLAIVIAVYRLRHTVQVDQIDLMRG
ncbi:MAG TPA: NADH-quinone oxidoreductase subunit NuoK [Chloroflexota bacterium]|jgi:NAD(P)H-quinone oxidoreductase subunit 4L|nr:NADH-quinone oxidoreductase subunit NuoK [Chloroflexota bacterium]